MENNLNKYEAAVKLSNNKVVIYHNINTGLFKFHTFINNKFADNWLYYTVRRVGGKEVIDTFRRETIKPIKAVRVFLPKARNTKSTGYFVRMPFERGETIINRNLFFSDKVILQSTDDYIVVPDEIFKKAISAAIKALTQYFEEHGHIVAADEFKAQENGLDKILITDVQAKSNAPTKDYP